MPQISRKEERRLDRERTEEQKKRRKRLERAAPEMAKEIGLEIEFLENLYDVLKNQYGHDFVGILYRRDKLRKARGE